MKAVKMYTDRHHANYLARMEDGTVRLATLALSGVFGGDASAELGRDLGRKSWDGRPTAREVAGADGRALLAALNRGIARREARRAAGAAEAAK